jgi:hypothetical protein
VIEVVDEKHRDYHGCFKDVEIPFMYREVSSYTLGKLRKTVYRTNLFLQLISLLLERITSTHKDQTTPNINGPQERHPFGVRPRSSESLREYMKTERDDDEKPER